MPSRNKEAFVDIVSYGRRGPQQGRMSPAQIEQIARTVKRVPEVMIKVLPKKGSITLNGVRRHFNYIGQRGEVELETDDGEKLSGKDIGTRLLEDWDLDLEEHRRGITTTGKGREDTKLVHKLVFSMPAGTPADRVLEAVRNFAREEFALQHRYVMALHTDRPHPHVHLILKAVSEQGVRLNIRPATLQEWRQEFARHLRVQGVPANATPRYIRGETKLRKSDGIYRAALRGESTHMREKTIAVAAELMKGDLRVEPGKERLVRTRQDVERGWRAMSEILAKYGQPVLGADVRRFLEQIPPARTDKELIAATLLERAKEPPVKERPTR